MKITLITVCFRSVAVIRTALESVLAQKNADFEYWVIDGGSDDGTVDVLREYEVRFNGRMRWISEPDRGMYDAINKGIARATGEFIGILNADDYLDGENVLKRVADEIERPTEEGVEPSGTSLLPGASRFAVDCVFGNVRFVRDFGGKTRRVCFARFWKPWMLHWGYMPPHPAIFIRKSCFEKWGGYVPDRNEYRIAADYELLVRYFCKNQMPYRYMPINTTVMRLGGVSTRDVEARKKLNEEIIKGNRVNGYFCCWPMLLPKYAIKVWEVILPRLGLMS